MQNRGLLRVLASLALLGSAATAAPEGNMGGHLVSGNVGDRSGFGFDRNKARRRAWKARRAWTARR